MAPLWVKYYYYLNSTNEEIEGQGHEIMCGHSHDYYATILPVFIKISEIILE